VVVGQANPAAHDRPALDLAKSLVSSRARGLLARSRKTRRESRDRPYPRLKGPMKRNLSHRATRVGGTLADTPSVFAEQRRGAREAELGRRRAPNSMRGTIRLPDAGTGPGTKLMILHRKTRDARLTPPSPQLSAASRSLCTRHPKVSDRGGDASGAGKPAGLHRTCRGRDGVTRARIFTHGVRRGHRLPG